MTTSLSFLGESRRLAELLAAVREVVRPDESAETWIEGVRDALVGWRASTASSRAVNARWEANPTAPARA